MHASDNQDPLPAVLRQATNYITNAEQTLTGTNQFELVAQGSMKTFTKAGCDRRKLVVEAGHAIAERLGFGDGDVGKLSRRQAHGSVPATICRINPDPDEQTLHRIFC